MPWGPRVADPSNVQAEGDKLYVYGQYNDVSGNLQPYMPVYKDLTDAAEWNVQNSATKLTTGTTVAAPGAGIPGLGVNQVQSVGRVVTATNVAAGGSISTGFVVAQLVGIFNPENVTARPSTGDVIRIQRFGATPAAISTGGVTVGVGYPLFTTTLQATLLAGAPSTALWPSIGANLVGRVLATAGVISAGAAVTPGTVNMSGNFWNTGSQYQIVNAWIDK